MATKNEPIVWIDCEMTGLDPKIDSLIEVAVLITDSNLEVLDTKGIDIVIKADKPEAVENMNDFVTQMHTNSGLIEEIKTGADLQDAEAEVLAYIQKFIPKPGKALLAGNSIGTDKAFLSEYMPKVVDHLHYRVIDVSTVKELARRWFPRAYFNAPKKAEGHRALADIIESIKELQYYREAVFLADPGYSSEELAEISKKYN
ncbi:MAG: oligoribonuclease [Micrococcaceae bacterium]